MCHFSSEIETSQFHITQCSAPFKRSIWGWKRKGLCCGVLEPVSHFFLSLN